MTSWNAQDLDRIAGSEELQIAPRLPDGTFTPATTIWVVRVADQLYARSWRGPSGGWYRQALTSRQGHIRAGGLDRDVMFAPADKDMRGAVDQAYRDKYHRYAGRYLEPMISDDAAATTLQLLAR
jgi:hypothetical protein